MQLPSHTTRTAQIAPGTPAPLDRLLPALPLSNGEVARELARQVAAGVDISVWSYADDPAGDPEPPTPMAGLLDRIAPAAPPDDLPPEDPSIAADPEQDLPGWTPALLLQPSLRLALGPLAGWRTAVARWAPTGGLATLVVDPPASHADPRGRPLTLRVRSLALGTLSVLLSLQVAESAHDALSTCCFASVTLELEGRAHRVAAPGAWLAGTDDRVPAAQLFRRLAAAGGAGPRVTPTPAVSAALDLRFRALLGLVEPTVAEPPAATSPAIDADNDPLGLDAWLERLTAPTVVAPEWAAADLDGEAVRLAGVIDHSRVRFAGLGVAIAETAAVWTAPPAASIGRALGRLDAELHAVHCHLSEIRLAARRGDARWDGLRRAAAATASAWRTGREELAEVLVGLLPQMPTLTEAPSTPEAIESVLEQVAAGKADLDQLAALRSSAGPTWAQALGVCLGGELIARGRGTEAKALAREQFALAHRRRDAISMAEAIVLACDATELLGGETRGIRLRGARSLGSPRAAGALSLVARWVPAV